MKAGFYPKLALDGIRKNKQLYLPYVMTCAVMVMMYYIISFLQQTDTLSDIKGIDTIRIVLNLGTWVIALFSAVFLFYTNSFLIRRRKKEFGLYNILGMGKRNISVILFWETFIIYIISIAIGLFVGIVLSKMAELALVLAIKGEVTYQLSISFSSALMAVILFAVIFLLLYLNAVRQVKFSSAVSLLRSENAGEKPPKGNWIIGILGVMLIAGGYIISLRIDDPITALTGFFIAVLLVIAGTYLTMISGSVLFCRLLQKNKRYYYKANHFVSVSSMIFRMKRNGAGLASICVLAAMVLVMISATTSLYTGAEGAINDRYPREVNVTLQYSKLDEKSEADIKSLLSEIRTVCDEFDVAPTDVVDYRAASITGQIQGDTVETNPMAVDGLTLYSYQDVATFNFLLLDDYNRMTGANVTLNNGEAMMISSKYDYKESTISFNSGKQFRIVDRLKTLFIPKNSIEYLIPVIYLIVPDINDAVSGIDRLADYNGNQMVQFYSYFYFNTDRESQTQIALAEKLGNTLASTESSSAHRFDFVKIESREEKRNSFYGLYGGLFYLGIILSLVFLMAAVLIIYYKQISEGYEDQKRFEIMQKVGMTKREIRKSINSQLLTVFFLPLVFAGLHLTFAFPVVSKLLMMFGVMNNTLLILTTIFCFGIFALFYAMVYKITSNAYYRIVSNNT